MTIMKISDHLTDETILAELGERITAARIALNLTQAQLAEQAGMKLLARPRAPQWSPIFEVAGSHKREAWRRFVADKHFHQASGKTG